MSTTTDLSNQPIEPVQRRPLDWLWFAILIASIATASA